MPVSGIFSFNKFALYMFGGILEKIVGTKRSLFTTWDCGSGRPRYMRRRLRPLCRLMSNSPLQLSCIADGACLSEGNESDDTMKNLQLYLTTDGGCIRGVFVLVLAIGVLFPKLRCASLPADSSRQNFCYSLGCHRIKDGCDSSP
jgi:hypothetical protein